MATHLNTTMPLPPSYLRLQHPLLNPKNIITPPLPLSHRFLHQRPPVVDRQLRLRSTHHIALPLQHKPARRLPLPSQITHRGIQRRKHVYDHRIGPGRRDDVEVAWGGAAGGVSIADEVDRGGNSGRGVVRENTRTARAEACGLGMVREGDGVKGGCAGDGREPKLVVVRVGPGVGSWGISGWAVFWWVAFWWRVG
ncbi:hypothetical protein P171DRAFT_498376 [Karstenula rhodostoma CBS 690.94]|uniref:Uncharacterized protein n=1 Tax=Karstenula rhodostoma CBS 690.94 TaxID=1392251 RepID=A0A9P4UA25_9PLEO|nr:hypothetical protein P171DRAFT_498376 [Karstenula rhodostoma CBS 690.94]